MDKSKAIDRLRKLLALTEVTNRHPPINKRNADYYTYNAYPHTTTRDRRESTLSIERAKKFIAKHNIDLFEPENIKALRDDTLAIPAFLDSRLWTAEDRKRSKLAWDKVELERRDDLQITNDEIFAKVRRRRHHKILREYNRGKRRTEKINRRTRKIERTRIREAHDEVVLDALHKGDNTVGKISKRTNLLTKEVRRSLKRFIKKSRVTKLSSRRYKIITRKRRRLSDVL